MDKEAFTLPAQLERKIAVIPPQKSRTPFLKKKELSFMPFYFGTKLSSIHKRDEIKQEAA